MLAQSHVLQIVIRVVLGVDVLVAAVFLLHLHALGKCRTIQRLLFGFREHLNHLCLLTAQTDLIAHELVLDRVLQGGIQHHFYRFTLDKAHFDDALAEATMTIYLHDDCVLTVLQFRQFHNLILFICKSSK